AEPRARGSPPMAPVAPGGRGPEAWFEAAAVFEAPPAFRGTHPGAVSHSDVRMTEAALPPLAGIHGQESRTRTRDWSSGSRIRRSRSRPRARGPTVGVCLFEPASTALDRSAYL